MCMGVCTNRNNQSPMEVKQLMTGKKGNGQRSSLGKSQREGGTEHKCRKWPLTDRTPLP